ncbi:MAG: ATP-binding protein [Candidatus Tumulicola sp.]
MTPMVRHPGGVLADDHRGKIVVAMCELGVLWRFESDDAAGVLRRRRVFLARLEDHPGWSLDTYAAKIIFTELVTNAMRHAPGPVRIVLECDGRQVALRITDRGPGFVFAPRLPPDAMSESGRGLFLVSKMAPSVRVEHLASGTAVVATLPRS